MPLCIGVSGGTGSGKSTLSHALIQRLGEGHVTYLPHDAYYKSLGEMPTIAGEVVNFDHPDALNTALMCEHITSLKVGQAVEAPIYDFRTHRRTEQSRVVAARPVILVEGILIFADPRLLSLFDMRVYVDTPDDVRLARRIRRDVQERGRSLETSLYQYEVCVRPMHLTYVEPNRHQAHVIVPEGGYNRVAADALTDYIRRAASL
jgi:uridine kinase